MASRTLVGSLAAALLLVSTIASSALATHVRPGGGTPMRVPLVPAFNSCGTITPDDPAPSAPNSTHAPPLAAPSCAPPAMKSTTATTGITGAGEGKVRLDVFCTDGAAPPCTTSAGDQEDINLVVTMSDVRCVVAVPGACAAPGADYTGSLIGRSIFRITDHSNGSPPVVCGGGVGAPPCTTATMNDITFSIAVPCADNGGPNGANCSVSTTIDTITGGFVREIQRGVVAIPNIRILDSGPDGSLAPPAGFCPIDCGSGDETKLAEQGLFLP
jgi:hypothetical protein